MKSIFLQELQLVLISKISDEDTPRSKNTDTDDNDFYSMLTEDTEPENTGTTNCNTQDVRGSGSVMITSRSFSEK